ncbi:ABC transporter substrate-binding protein [Paenibacillus sepulcri]|uniref:Extracellular solute-binding protein n=1 Tax=Paenibacillus sepulcri TaxID=359917 RepID=A0ABS7CC03_9BACL|nr:extracellular solute-binding protein [Paenibacillus sepulcri]
MSEQTKREADDPSMAEHSGKAKLVISTYSRNEQIQTAVKKYEALHPNIEIDLQVAQTDVNDPDKQLADQEKFVAAANTAMLAGKGPDLIEMDLLPTEKYVNRNLLVNLSDLMQQDPTFKKEDYFTNILDNSQINGGLYAMPLSFYLSGLIGDEGALVKAGEQVNDQNWSWSEFAEMAKQLSQKGGYEHAFGSSPDYMLTEMVSENYGLFVDEANGRASFDSASFTGLMKQVKAMFDEGVVYDALAGGRKNIKKTYFEEAQIQSPADYLYVLEAYASQAKFYTKPHAQEMGDGGYFRARQTLGISASSPVKKEAWDFIHFLLSEEANSIPGNTSVSSGFPIDKSAYDKQIKQLRDEGVQAYKNGPANSSAIKPDSTMLKRLDQLEANVTGAVHALGKPSRIDEIVTEECQAFFSGQKSAEDVAKLIQNKVVLYLNE